MCIFNPLGDYLQSPPVRAIHNPAQSVASSLGLQCRQIARRQLHEINRQLFEHDIAAVAKRQVHLKDGMLERDFLNQPVETAV